MYQNSLSLTASVDFWQLGANDSFCSMWTPYWQFINLHLVIATLKELTLLRVTLVALNTRLERVTSRMPPVVCGPKLRSAGFLQEMWASEIWPCIVTLLSIIFLCSPSGSSQPYGCNSLSLPSRQILPPSRTSRNACGRLWHGFREEPQRGKSWPVRCETKRQSLSSSSAPAENQNVKTS